MTLAQTEFEVNGEASQLEEIVVVNFDQILEILGLPTLERMRELITSALQREQDAESLYAELVGLAEHFSQEIRLSVNDFDENGMYAMQIGGVTYKYNRACWDQLSEYKTNKFFYYRVLIKYLSRFSTFLKLLDPQQSISLIYRDIS